MKTNIRDIARTRVAAWLRVHPDAVAVEWDEDGGHFDGLRLVDGQTFIIATVYQDTDAARAAAAAAATAEAAARTKLEARLNRLRDIRAKIKAGTDTATDRSRAIRLLIGVVLNLAPEDDGQ